MRAAAGIILLAAALLLGGCATLGYYGQSVGGQLEVLARRRPIGELLETPETDPRLRAELEPVPKLRAFAVRELALPDNGSFRDYADLGRPYVVWNVYAAAELSLEPRRWCFPFAGCVNYRGYFSKEAAESYAAELRTRGEDVYVGGVTGYSTLGWFADPLLNTQLGRGEAAIAALIFHELAHERLYVAGDTAFNESFATVVEREGLRRWFEQSDRPRELARFRERRARIERIAALILEHRTELAVLFASDAAPEEKRAGKQRVFENLRAAYARLRAQGQGTAGYDRWFEDEFNNAKLVPVALYRRDLATFESLLARCGGDLAAFYGAVEAIARLPDTERRLALANPAQPACGPM